MTGLVLRGGEAYFLTFYLGIFRLNFASLPSKPLPPFTRLPH